MEKELVKITKKSEAAKTCLEIELSGNVVEIAEALLETVESRQDIRLAFGHLCGQRLIKNLENCIKQI